jgi:hypothetical protein
MARVFKTGVTTEGDVSVTGAVTASSNLRSTNSSGDEGGEIFLNKSATNTTLTGGVTIDVWQNRLRFFEQGGSARGYYIDISTGGNGVATQLVGVGSTSSALTVGTSGLTMTTGSSPWSGSAAATIDIDTAKVPRLTTNTNTFVAASGATSFVVKQGPAQSTTDIMQWQDNSGIRQGFVSSGGNTITFPGMYATYNMTATAGGSTVVPMVVTGAASQTANLQEWKNNSPSTVASISNTGAFTTPSVTLPGSTSGTIQLLPTAIAGTGTVLTLPATTGTVALTSQLPTVNDGTLTLAVSGTGLSGSQTFTANQSGAATFTVTSNATSANSASTIVARDVSGSFVGNVITATTGFSGIGTSLTNLNGSNVSSGTVSSAYLPSASNVASGIVTITAQSFSGRKSFFDGINISGSATTIQLGGNAGTAGYVMTSQGGATLPTWSELPYRIAANRTTSAGGTALTVNTQETVTGTTITFPASRFSGTPAVTASTSSARLGVSVSSVSNTAFTMIVRNVSDATATTYTFNWIAVEITAGMGN